MAASKGKAGKVGLQGPAVKSKLCKQREKKKSSVQDDSSPDNTRRVASNDHEANFAFRDVRLMQNLSSKGNKGGYDLRKVNNTRKRQQPFQGVQAPQHQKLAKNLIFNIEII